MGLIGKGGSLLNTSANPFDKDQGGKLGNWDVVGNALDSANPNVGGAKKQDASNADMAKNVQNQYNDTQGVLGTQAQQGSQYIGGLQSAGNTYKSDTGNNVGAYTQGITGNTGAYTGGVADTTKQYTGDVTNSTNQYVQGQQGLQVTYNPMYGQLTGQAMGNASGAMTLQDAQNPNNAVEQGVQGMYNQQAQGIQNQGLADYGTMSALGNEATANTMGSSGMPMTGAQMQLLQGSNTAQAGQAFANAQNQANQLKMQGLGAGLNQSNLMYEQGQQAHQQAVGDVGTQAGFNQGGLQNIYGAQQAGAGNVYNAQQGGLSSVFNANNNATNSVFGANQGQASTNYNVDTGMAGAQYGVDQAQNNAQLAAQNQKYGGQGGIILGNAAYNQATGQANMNMASSVIGGVAGAAMSKPPQQPPPQKPPPNGPPSDTGIVDYQPGSSFPQGSPYADPNAQPNRYA